jgi:hypothetical protein
MLIFSLETSFHLRILQADTRMRKPVCAPSRPILILTDQIFFGKFHASIFFERVY